MATLSRLAKVSVTEIRSLGGGKRAAVLEKAGITTVADLLMHVPRTYIDRTASPPIASAEIGAEVTIIGKVSRVDERRPRRGLLIVEAVVTDGTSRLRAVWFNQPYRSKQVAPGMEVAVSGKIE